jgi:hypothetical protein
MRFFFKLSAAILMISLLICGASVGWARRNPLENPLAKLGISKCDDDLCIMTIRPGKTLWANSLTILRSKPHVTVLEDVIHFDDQNLMTAFYENAIYTAVSLRSVPGSQLMSTGDVIEYFGAPCSINMVIKGGSMMFLNYPDFVAEIDLTGARDQAVSPEMPVFGLFLAGATSDCNSSNSESLARWCGFTTFAEYMGRCLEMTLEE